MRFISDSLYVRTHTFYHVLQNVFVAVNNHWVLLLNFDGNETVLNLTEVLLEHGITPGVAAVTARSVNGTDLNQVDSIKLLNEDLIIGSNEAILLYFIL